MLTIYHNPRCSKSRDTLELIRARGIEPTIVCYLEQPPTAAELQKLLALLGMTPAELLRRGEDEFRALGLDQPGISPEAMIAAMVSHPRLIERPIVSNGRRAVLGRPPENALTLL